MVECGPWVCPYPKLTSLTNRIRRGAKWTCPNCGTRYKLSRPIPRRPWRKSYAPQGRWRLLHFACLHRKPADWSTALNTTMKQSDTFTATESGLYHLTAKVPFPDPGPVSSVRPDNPNPTWEDVAAAWDDAAKAWDKTSKEWKATRQAWEW